MTDEATEICGEGPCNSAANRRLEVFGQSAASPEPSKGPFNNPASWQQLKPGGVTWAIDVFDLPLSDALQLGAQFLSSMAAVGKYMPQSRIEIADRSEHQTRAVAILNAGRMHGDANQVALRICNNVALATFDLLARIIATQPAAFGRFHRLAVNDPGRRT